MNKFCIMLGYFSIFVLIVSGIVSEDNKTFVNGTVIENENQTVKFEDQKITKDAGLVDLKPKTLPASNITLKSNGNNTDQKNSVSSQLTEVQLDENGKSRNWKDFQNKTFSSTVVNKANKTVKIKIRKVKLNRNLVNQNSLQENPSFNNNTSNNYTDQEPAESSIHIEVGSIPQNRKSLYVENDQRFVNWKSIGTNVIKGAVNKTLTFKSENLSPKIKFEVNRNVQKNSSTTPSQPENRIEKPAINFNSTQNFNNWKNSHPSSKINVGVAQQNSSVATPSETEKRLKKSAKFALNFGNPQNFNNGNRSKINFGVNRNAQQNSSTTSNVTPSQPENRLKKPSINFNNTRNFNNWKYSRPSSKVNFGVAQKSSSVTTPKTIPSETENLLKKSATFAQNFNNGNRSNPSPKINFEVNGSDQQNSSTTSYITPSQSENRLEKPAINLNSTQNFNNWNYSHPSLKINFGVAQESSLVTTPKTIPSETENPLKKSATFALNFNDLQNLNNGNRSNPSSKINFVVNGSAQQNSSTTSNITPSQPENRLEKPAINLDSTQNFNNWNYSHPSSKINFGVAQQNSVTTPKTIPSETENRFKKSKTFAVDFNNPENFNNINYLNSSPKINFEVNGSVQQKPSTTSNITPSQSENRLEKPAINLNNTQNFNNWNYSHPSFAQQNSMTTPSKTENRLEKSETFAVDFNNPQHFNNASYLNSSPKMNFEVNGSVQQILWPTSNISPSQPENRLEKPTIFSIGFNNTQNFNDWRGMDTFSDASEIQGEKVELFQHFSQIFDDKRNSTTSTPPPLSSNETSLVDNRTSEISEELKKTFSNKTNFKLDTVNFDNSSTSAWGSIDFGTNQTVKVNEEEELENVNLQQNSSNLSIQENSNATSHNRNDEIGEVVDTLNKFNIEYFNVNRKLIQNRNKNFNQISFDDGSDWKAIVGVLPITSNKTSTIRNQTINLPINYNVRYVYGIPSNQNKQSSANKTVDLTTNGRYADYQPSGSADNFQLQPFGENFEEANLGAFTNVGNQEPHFEEAQISKPSITDEFENAHFENQGTEKFISDGNWNLEDEWKAIDGSNNPKYHHISTETEIKIEKHVPFPYPIEKNILYPVEKQVPYPVKVEVPSPYPVIKEVRVPQKVSVTVPVPIYKPIPVEKVVKYPVRIPVDQPYPVQVKIPHYYPVEVQIPFPVKVKVPQPIPIIKKVPYEVKHIYRVPKPYPVHKNVYYPVKVHFERLVRYNVYKPVPYKVYKNVYVPYYVEKPYPVKVYEDKGVHHPPVGEKPQFFDHPPHPIENHQPFRYKEQPELYEDKGVHDPPVGEKPQFFDHLPHPIENHQPFRYKEHPEVYEDKDVHDPTVGEKPQFFDPIENHQPFRYKEQPEAIPVYEENIEKNPSEFESNAWKVNFDPFGEVNP